MAISQYTMDRIFRGIRKIEKIELSPNYGPENRVYAEEELFVLVTGSKNGYFYPGTVTFRNPTYPDQQTDNKYTDSTYYDPTVTVLVEAINDEPLLTGSRYLGKFTTWHTDPITGVGLPVYTVVYTPPVGYGYGSGNIPDHPPISSVSWTGQVDTSASGCTLGITRATYYLIDDESIGMLLIITPSSHSVPLGPFPLHGTVNVVIPGQSGTISGTAGSCAISGTVSVPGQTVTADLSGNTACP